MPIVLLPTDRKDGDKIEASDINAIAAAVNELAAALGVVVEPPPLGRTYRRLFSVGHSFSVAVGSADATDGMSDALADLLAMPTTSLDSFDRLDAGTSIEETFASKTPSTTTLGYTPDGRGWANQTGVWGTDANGAYVVSVAGSTAVATFDAPSADGGMRFTRGAGFVTADGDTGVILKWVNSSNYIWLDLNWQFGAGVIRKVVGGSSTTILSSIGTPSAGRSCRVEWVGSSTTGGLVIKAWTDGVSKGSATVNDAVFDGVTTVGLKGIMTTPPMTGRVTGIEWYTPGAGLGNGWKNVAGQTMRIVGGDARVQYADDSKAIVVKDFGSGDGLFEMGMTDDSANGTSMILRYQDPSNYIYVQASASFGGWSLIKRIGGVNTTVIAQLGGNNRAGTTLRVQLYGDRMRVGAPGWTSQSGAADFKLPTDVAFLQSNTRHGWGQLSTVAPSPRVSQFTYQPFWNFGRGGQRVACTLPFMTTDGQGGTPADVLQRLPLLNRDDVVTYVWGTNDSIFTNYPWPDNYARGYDAVIARALSAAVWEATDPIVTYSGTWSTVTSVLENSGTGYRRTSAVGAVATINLPLSYAGGRLVIGVQGRQGAIGGQAEIRIDGDFVANVDTSNVWTGTGTYTSSLVVHLPAQSDGAHTITITTTGIDGNFDWDYVAELHDPTNAPSVLAHNDPRLPVSPEYELDAGSATTATVTAATWAPDQFAGWRVKIIGGTSNGEQGHVTSNTGTVLTIANSGGSSGDTWSVGPDSTSRIKLYNPSIGGTIWGGGTDAQHQSFSAALAAMLTTTYAEFDSVRLVDMDAVLGNDPALFSPDGVHPNQTGHTALAVEAYAVLTADA